jgi:protein-L-isoaspartate(D-aspartate) O-methyltransferase
MDEVPRERFVEEADMSRAWENRALPISCGQTISQPYVVAYMTQQLEVEPGMRVLEVGTGSGYQTAILSRLGTRVYSLERHAPLLLRAQKKIEMEGLANIRTRHADGYQGWYEEAPFDRILVTAAFPAFPEALAEQLTPGGIMVTPIGKETISQGLWKIIRITGGGLRQNGAFAGGLRPDGRGHAGRPRGHS